MERLLGDSLAPRSAGCAARLDKRRPHSHFGFNARIPRPKYVMSIISQDSENLPSRALKLLVSLRLERKRLAQRPTL